MEFPFGSMGTTNFRRFTPESLAKIEKQIAAHRAAKKARAKHRRQKDKGEKPRPQLDLKACNQLPRFYGELPAELVGEPLEDLDPYYSTHRVRPATGNICTQLSGSEPQSHPTQEVLTSTPCTSCSLKNRVT